MLAEAISWHAAGSGAFHSKAFAELSSQGASSVLLATVDHVQVLTHRSQAGSPRARRGSRRNHGSRVLPSSPRAAKRGALHQRVQKVHANVGGTCSLRRSNTQAAAARPGFCAVDIFARITPTSSVCSNESSVDIMRAAKHQSHTPSLTCWSQPARLRAMLSMVAGWARAVGWVFSGLPPRQWKTARACLAAAASLV